MVHLCLVVGNTVIPHGKWRPVALICVSHEELHSALPFFTLYENVMELGNLCLKNYWLQRRQSARWENARQSKAVRKSMKRRFEIKLLHLRRRMKVMTRQRLPRKTKYVTVLIYNHENRRLNIWLRTKHVSWKCVSHVPGRKPYREA